MTRCAPTSQASSPAAIASTAGPPSSRPFATASKAAAPSIAPRRQAPRHAAKAHTPPRIEPDNGTVNHFQADYRLTTAPKLCKGCNICVTGCPSHTLRLDANNHIKSSIPTPASSAACARRVPRLCHLDQPRQLRTRRVFAQEGGPVS
jgi:ferredoxin